ncbi:hypothetical protein Tco_0075631, partial [Tanacetum coccineum]
HINNPATCHSLLDHVTPPGFWADLCNQGDAGETFERKFTDSATIVQQRDVEVADLKAMLERSEAEAAEVVELRKRVSDLEAMVAVKTGEVANLNTQNAGLLEKVSAIELVCGELYGKVSQLTADCDGLKSRVVGEDKMQEEFVSQQDATERGFADRLRSWMPALLM